LTDNLHGGSMAAECRLWRPNRLIDWTVKELVRGTLREFDRRILRKCGYRLDKQEKATQTVMEQGELVRAEAMG